jgi:ABC-2 type transport system permease protein
MTTLRNIGAILEKEWRHYFGSPIAYVAICMWTLLFGLFYQFAVDMFVEQSFRMSAQEFGGAAKLSMNDYLIRPVLQNMAVVGLFVLPMLTMRLFAEEKRTGTLELLATAPLTDWQIVLGKFLGALALYVVMLAVTMLNIVVLWFLASSPPEWKPIATGLLSLLLVGASFISLGLFLSTLTRNQVIAGILGFGMALVFWIFSWFDRPTADAFQKVIAYLGITNHMEDMAKGIIDLKDVVFYLSFIGFGLFLAQQSVESQRWRA